ncbi:MAG: manganese catalase family protein [Clostridia bacterium]|nr:manganese catalase family protein [Clostridia bacterium]
MPKPLIVDLPYPTTDDICHDALSLKILSPAYASPNGELNAILQYVYHSFFFDRVEYTDYHDILMRIAVAEMMHLELLGETILALGASPIYTRYPSSVFDFYSTKYVAYSCSLKNMLEDDIIGERRAIISYENMLKRLRNVKVSEIVSRIVLDEKLHLETLEKLYKDFKC